MIFFEDNINPFNSAGGMLVTPISCELNDNRAGYYLGGEWKEKIEVKGAIIEQITKADIKQSEEI